MKHQEGRDKQQGQQQGHTSLIRRKQSQDFTFAASMLHACMTLHTRRPPRRPDPPWRPKLTQYLGATRESPPAKPPPTHVQNNAATRLGYVNIIGLPASNCAEKSFASFVASTLRMSSGRPLRGIQ